MVHHFHIPHAHRERAVRTLIERVVLELQVEERISRFYASVRDRSTILVLDLDDAG